MKNKAVLIPFIFVIAIFTGCASSSKALESYKQNIEQFYTNVMIIDEKMNSLNTSDDDYKAKLLSCLDQFKHTVEQMSSINAPEEYKDIDTVLADTFNNISEAVELYHYIFENEYDADKADEAYQKYLKANNELHMIIDILHETYNDTESDSE